jgi:quinolinate synthase
MNMENHGGMILTGTTSDMYTRAHWQSYQQRHLVAKQENMTKEMIHLTSQSTFVHISKGSLTCPKILQLRANYEYFTYPPKKGVL